MRWWAISWAIVARNQAGRGVHVYVGLPGEGEVHPGKAQAALEPGEKNWLGPYGIHSKAREFPCQVFIDLRAGLEHSLPVCGEVPLPVPGDLAGQPGGVWAK